MSVYGLSVESYESVSGIKGSFEKVMNGLTILMKYKVPVTINFPILPQNRHEAKVVEKWFAEKFGIINVIPLQMYLDMHTRRKKIDSERIIKHRLTPKEQLEIRIGEKSTLKEDFYKHFSKITTLVGPPIFYCGAGCGKGTVDAYGILQMCARLRHPETVYDLSHGSLKHAYRSFFPKIRKKIAENDEYLNRCGNCFLKGFCDHCAAHSWTEFGDLESVSDYICEIAQLEAQYLGLLSRSEQSWLISDWKKRVSSFMEETRDR